MVAAIYLHIYTAACKSRFTRTYTVSLEIFETWPDLVQWEQGTQSNISETKYFNSYLS